MYITPVSGSPQIADGDVNDFVCTESGDKVPENPPPGTIRITGCFPCGFVRYTSPVVSCNQAPDEVSMGALSLHGLATAPSEQILPPFATEGKIVDDSSNRGSMTWKFGY
jgi:hypothetical protein